jgi:hypothetical protein
MAAKKTTVFSVRLEPRILQKLRWKAVELSTDPTELARRLIADGVRDAKQPVDTKNPAIQVPAELWTRIESAATSLGATPEDFILAWARHGVDRTDA